MSRVSYSGFRNGFPFVLKDYADKSVQDKTLYPCKVSRATSSKWWWRVKEWYISWSVTGTSSSASGAVRVYLNSYGYPLDESGRCIGTRMTYSRTTLQQSGDSNLYIFPYFRILPDGCFDGNQTRLRLSVGFAVLGPPLFSNYYGLWEEGESFPQSNISCTVDGEVVPIYCDLVPDGVAWFPTVITITPYKFWSYDGLYDDETGSLIAADAPGLDFSEPYNSQYHPSL